MYRNEWLPEAFNNFIENSILRANTTAPAINVLESANNYTVELAAPGMRKEDFDVNINADGDLTIKMESHQDQGENHAHYLRREFSYGKFEQTLILPDDVDKDKIGAMVTDGVLTITLPKVVKEEQKAARQITVD